MNMANMFLTVKAFVSREGQEANINDNIRKFIIDKTCCGSFNYLKQKLMQMVPELKGKEFVITWRDSDGDNVRMTNDEELMVALLESTSNSVLKINVTIKGSQSIKKDLGAATRGGVHPGVCCDECNGEVRGNRYKCKVCPDYDLCARCESAGSHLNHKMIRIPQPAEERTIFEGFLPTNNKSMVRLPQGMAIVKPHQPKCPLQCNKNMPMFEVLKDCCDPQLLMALEDYPCMTKKLNCKKPKKIAKRLAKPRNCDEDYLPYILEALGASAPEFVVLRKDSDTKAKKMDEKTEQVVNKKTSKPTTENEHLLLLKEALGPAFPMFVQLRDKVYESTKPQVSNEKPKKPATKLNVEDEHMQSIKEALGPAFPLFVQLRDYVEDNSQAQESTKEPNEKPKRATTNSKTDDGHLQSIKEALGPAFPIFVQLRDKVNDDMQDKESSRTAGEEPTKEVTSKPNTEKAHLESLKEALGPSFQTFLQLRAEVNDNAHTEVNDKKAKDQAEKEQKANQEEQAKEKPAEDDPVKSIDDAMAFVFPQFLVMKSLLEQGNEKKENKQEDESLKKPDEATAQAEKEETPEHVTIDDDASSTKAVMSTPTTPDSEPEQWELIQDEKPVESTPTEADKGSIEEEVENAIGGPIKVKVSQPMPLTTLAALTALANPGFVTVTTTTAAPAEASATKSSSALSKSATTTPVKPTSAEDLQKGTQTPIVLMPVPKQLKTVEDRLAETKERMIGRGYSDEGGWLTKLIQAKDGDFDEVMKALSPFA